MRRHPRFALVVAVIATVLCAVAAVAEAQDDQQIRLPLSFSPADLSFGKLAGYDTVTLRGADLEFHTGLPVIPVRHVRLALPIGHKAVSVEWETGDAVALPGTYRLAPGTEPVPLSAQGITRELREGSAYRSTSSFPAEVCELVGTGWKSGYPIADVSVYPLRYDPARGRLTLFKSIVVTVWTEPSSEGPPALSPRPERTEAMIRDSVTQLVDNPDAVPASASATGPAIADGGTATYLVITSTDLSTYFQPLVDWKLQKGMTAEIVTTSYIDSTYPGEQAGDQQDKIRQCIKDYWDTRATLYVLLGGDVSIIPYRPAFAMAGSNGDAIPCDLYYSDLDGTWDGDGDGTYGEYPEDGIDFYSDVYVARAPVQTHYEALVFVNKTLQYEGGGPQGPPPVDYELNMLALASMLDSSTDSAVLMETIDRESIPPEWNITKLYQSSGNLSRTSTINALNSGMNLVAHGGHGGTGGVQVGGDFLSSGDVAGLTNAPRFSAIMYSMSCYSGEFPADDCFGEHFSRAISGGGPYIGNSRYGWYYVGWPDYGLSAQFERWFFKALLDGYNRDHLGEAHGFAKDLGVGWSKTDATQRFCHYGLNLFGDPEMPVWKALPMSLDVTHEPEIGTGEPTFIVTVEGDGAPLRFAKACIWKGTEVYAVVETNANGIARFHPYPATPGEMLVTVTASDYLPAESVVNVLQTGLAGTVELQSIAGSPAGTEVDIEFRYQATGQTAAVYTAVLGANGEYSVPATLRGTYDISLKHANWLRQTLPSVLVTGPTHVDFSLVNGDADHNNSVDLLDLSCVLSSFGGSGGPHDLDCDGEVGVGDLNIVITNFSKTGDS
jgi:hypothetical protein